MTVARKAQAQMGCRQSSLWPQAEEGALMGPGGSLLCLFPLPGILAEAPSK